LDQALRRLKMPVGRAAGSGAQGIEDLRRGDEIAVSRVSLRALVRRAMRREGLRGSGIFFRLSETVRDGQGKKSGLGKQPAEQTVAKQ